LGYKKAARNLKRDPAAARSLECRLRKRRARDAQVRALEERGLAGGLVGLDAEYVAQDAALFGAERVLVAR